MNPNENKERVKPQIRVIAISVSFVFMVKSNWCCNTQNKTKMKIAEILMQYCIASTHYTTSMHEYNRMNEIVQW